MGTPMKSLYGRLLTLRPINIEQDAPEWFEVMQEPEMHLWTGNQIPKDLNEVRDVVLATYVNHPEIFAWCIIETATQKMIGIYWIGIPFVSDGGELVSFDAQRIAKLYWRKGYTKEARFLVYRYAFEELMVAEIHAQAWEPNRNSCLSMENAGFELVRSYPRFNSKYDSELIEREYVLRREKWLQLNRKLY